MSVPGAPWTLLVGVGNRQRGDDAAGLVVADRVRNEGVTVDAVIACEGDCLALIERWSADDNVVIVDAAAPAGRPGRISRHLAHREPLPAAIARASTHLFGVPEMIELARILGRLPRRLEVYGIEGAGVGLGDGLSPAVVDATECVAAVLLERQVVTRSRSRRSR